MTTPQRALELADRHADMSRRDRSYVGVVLEDREKWDLVFQMSAAFHAETATILRHYAEIMQTVAAAYARESDLDVLKTRMSEPWPSMIYVSSHRMKTDLVTTELIIKPKPLP